MSQYYFVLFAVVSGSVQARPKIGPVFNQVYEPGLEYYNVRESFFDLIFSSPKPNKFYFVSFLPDSSKKRYSSCPERSITISKT